MMKRYPSHGQPDAVIASLGKFSDPMMGMTLELIVLAAGVVGSARGFGYNTVDTACTTPSDIKSTSYVVDEVDVDLETFDVRVSCAEGLMGAPYATACAAAGDAYAVGGACVDADSADDCVVEKAYDVDDWYMDSLTPEDLSNSADLEGCTSLSGEPHAYWTANDDAAAFASLMATSANLRFLESGATQMPDLSNLAVVTGELSFESVAFAGTLELPTLKAVKYFEVTKSPGVEEISLPQLTTAYFFSVADCGALTSVSAPKLRSTQGDFKFDGLPSLETLDFPLLAHIQDDLKLYNTSLTTFSLPALKAVADSTYIQNNGALETVSMPELAYMYQPKFQENPSLEKLSLPALTVAKDPMYITQNDALTEVDLGSLEQVQDLYVQENAALESLSLPSLLAVTELVLSNNDALESFSAPKVTAISDQLSVEECPLLETFDFASLDSVGKLTYKGSGVPSAGGFPRLLTLGDYFGFDGNSEYGDYVDLSANQVQAAAPMLLDAPWTHA